MPTQVDVHDGCSGRSTLHTIRSTLQRKVERGNAVSQHVWARVWKPLTHSMFSRVKRMGLHFLLLNPTCSTIAMLHTLIKSIAMDWWQTTPAQPEEHVVILLPPAPVRIGETIYGEIEPQRYEQDAPSKAQWVQHAREGRWKLVVLCRCPLTLVACVSGDWKAINVMNGKIYR